MWLFLHKKIKGSDKTSKEKEMSEHRHLMFSETFKNVQYLAYIQN